MPEKSCWSRSTRGSGPRHRSCSWCVAVLPGGHRAHRLVATMPTSPFEPRGISSTQACAGTLRACAELHHPCVLAHERADPVVRISMLAVLAPCSCRCPPDFLVWRATESKTLAAGLALLVSSKSFVDYSTADGNALSHSFVLFLLSWLAAGPCDAGLVPTALRPMLFACVLVWL